MADILEEVMKFIPDKNKISDSYFEGANIVLYTKDKDFFLDNNGIIKQIVDSIKKRVEEWIRVTFLGAGRQVGRSCLFLQTPESKILLDCGINVSAQTNEEMFPLLEAPEFKIDELDAVIISHSHIDHV